jgi:glycosyltransferase involved in cell wall biosynthesis
LGELIVITSGERGKAQQRRREVAKTQQHSRWLFILGVNNSGTSLLDYLLRQHPEIAGLPSEGQYLTSALPRPWDHGVGRLWTQRLDQFRLMEQDSGDRAESAKTDWSRHFGSDSSHQYQLEKSPPRTIQSRWLQRWFQPATFIAIVRDPHAVCEGIRRRRGCEIESAALHWTIGNQIMLNDLPHLQRSILIRYEQLVCDPDGELAKLKRFLSLDSEFAPEIADLPCDAPNHLGTPVKMSDMNRNSKNNLSQDDCRVIDRWTGELWSKITCTDLASRERPLMNEQEMLPMISCIMPTYGRPAFVGEAVQMFLDQDYPPDRCEIVVLNDCAEQQFTIDDSLASRVKVINCKTRFPTLGDKRNACIEAAGGDLIAVWDDDDLYMPWRLSYSLEQMQAHQTRFYRPDSYWAYWGKDKLHVNHATRRWISHSLCLLEKELWRESGGYPAMDVGEDAVFFKRIHETISGDPEAWTVYPIADNDRYYVLRGLSDYQHISIGGGKRPLDTAPGVYNIQPSPIADPVLRDIFQRLIKRRTDSAIDQPPLSHIDQATVEVDTVPYLPIIVREERQEICRSCPQYHQSSEDELVCELAGSQAVPWSLSKCRLRKWSAVVT